MPSANAESTSTAPPPRSPWRRRPWITGAVAGIASGLGFTLAALAGVDGPHVDVPPTGARPWRFEVDGVGGVQAASAAAAAGVTAPGMAFLPALGCPNSELGLSLVTVQNAGTEPTKAILVVFDTYDVLESPCSVPGFDALQCTGLINPGGSWTLSVTGGDSLVRSGVVFSVTARRLSEIGVAGEADDIAADALCAALGTHVVGSCTGFARLRSTWATGGAFAGIPLDRAAGRHIVVHVVRQCASPFVPGIADTAAMPGISGDALGSPDAVGQYTYRAAPLHNTTRSGSGADRSSLLHIQNAGAVTATFSVDLQLLNACAAWRPCGSMDVGPGGSRVIDIDTCAIRNRSYTAAITSDQPLAIVVETTDQRGGQLVYNAVPQAAVDGTAGGAREQASGAGAELMAPLWLDDRYGWDAAVTIQNHAPAVDAVVDVAFLDRGGRPLHTERRSICAGGADSVSASLTETRPGERVGSVRVRSHVPPDASPAPVSAVLEMTRFADSGRAEVVEAFAESLAPVAVPAPGGGAAARGTTVIGLPLVADNLDGTGIASEVVVANRGTAPGWTDVAVIVLDQNAPVRTLCQRLAAGAVHAFDVSPYFTATDPGFIGSAVVSATAWSHPPPGTVHPAGGAAGAVDLAAAVVTRVGTLRDEDIPGDQVGVAEGVPLAAIPPGLAGLGRVCGADDPDRLVVPTPVVTPLPTAEPPAGRGEPAVAMLPAVAFQGMDDVCMASMVVHNQGIAAAKALLVFWTERDPCAPDCFGPIGTTCTALLAPGQAWSLPQALMPGSISSAAAYGFTDRTLGDLGVEPGSTVTAADAVCTRIRPLLVARSCPAARAFHLAYLTGTDFEGLPLGKLYSGAVGADVTRVCPGDFNPGRVVTAAYAALPRDAWLRDVDDLGSGSHAYAASPVFADRAGFNTVMYLQNAGLGCASVTLAFRAWGDCQGARICHVLSIAPGAVESFDGTDCVGPDWAGSVVVTATEPLAIALDHFGLDLLRTRTAVAGRLPFDLDANGVTDAADGAVIEAARGSAPGTPGWNPRADLSGDDRVNADDDKILAANLCQVGLPAAEWPAPPGPAPRRQVLLPTLLTGAPPCDAVVSLQNVGDAPSKAVLVLWKAGVAGLACAPPARVECTGLIAPGQGWTWISTPGPDRSGAVAGGIVFSFTAETFEDLGLSGTGVVADAVCARLQADLGGDCDAFLRFRRAYDGGGTYADVPMARVLGAPLAADVRRTCVSPGDASRGGGHAVFAYEGIAATEVGTFDPTAGAFDYAVPLAYVNIAGFETRIFVQNAGLEPAVVDVWMDHIAACDRASDSRPCNRIDVAPGATAVVNPSVCVGPDWQGSAWIRGSQPLAIVGEVYGRGLADFTGVPVGPVPSDPATDAAGLPGRGAARVAYGPLIHDPEHAWDSGVNVKNLSLTHDAQVQVAFLDPGGTPFSTQERTICAGGTDTFFVPVTNNLPGAGEVGSVRVISRAARAGAPPPPIAATALLLRHIDPDRTQALDMLTYDLVPEAGAYRWPVGAGAGGQASGAAVIALPDVADLRDPLEMAEIVVSNLVPVPGRTDIDIAIIGRDGTVATLKRSLPAGATTVVDVREAAAAAGVALPPNFRAAALVSATYWDHAVATADGRRRPLVGLASVVVRRGRVAPDAPSAARASVTAGRPLARLPGGAPPPAAPAWFRLWLPFAGQDVATPPAGAPRAAARN